MAAAARGGEAAWGVVGGGTGDGDRAGWNGNLPHGAVDGFQRNLGPFQMRVELHGPERVSNLAAIMKSLLDGLISAFHGEARPSAEAVRRLAVRTGWDAAEIQARLQAPACPILGPRRLLAPYRDFIKWNPADERCESCTILQQTAARASCLVQVWELPQSPPGSNHGGQVPWEG